MTNIDHLQRLGFDKGIILDTCLTPELGLDESILRKILFEED